MRSDRSSIEPTIITPQTGWGSIDWRELWEYRDLLYFLVWRDIKALYAQTVMGVAWAVIRPLFSMIVFSIVFGGLAKVPSDGVPYPIFSYAALVPWTYFNTSMSGATSSLISNVNVLKKVYFPRLLIPMTPVLSGLVDFLISFSILFVLMIVYGIWSGWAILALPYLVVLLILTALGVGTWLSALAVQYRDVKHGVAFLGQLLMYAAPVVWPVSLISEKFPHWGSVIRPLYGLYPMVGVIEGFRAALLGTSVMPWDMLVTGTLSAVLMLVSGILYFNRMERIFADVA